MKKFIITTTFIFYYLLTIAQAPTSGLVSYCKMDGNFINEINTALNGSNSGATNTANNAGALNRAMQFNNPSAAVTQFAIQSTNASINFASTASFSLSFFINVTSPFAGHTIGVYDNNLNYGGYGAFLWNLYGFPQIYFHFKNGRVGSTNGAITLGNWMHITLVNNANSLSIYINGVLNASGTAGGTSPTYTYTARIGSMFYNSFSPPQYNGFVGKIDEMRIYNRALTQAEINQIQVLLPLKLLHFDASSNNSTVKLQWQTTDEQNTSHFIIERSIDGQNFTAIQHVTAAGNSNIIKNYTYSDNLTTALLQNKIVFYRLKMVDQDQSFSLSKIIPINIESSTSTMQIWPNPVSEVLKIKNIGFGTAASTFTIMDNNGKTIKTLHKTISISQPLTEINISDIQSGTYFLKIITKNKVYYQQFVIVH